jgi:hypothetical protein
MYINRKLELLKLFQELGQGERDKGQWWRR